MRRFNKLSHPFEITLARGCTIELCEDTEAIPTRQYNFIPLDRIEVKTSLVYIICIDMYV